jgi:hypothetical protein
MSNSISPERVRYIKLGRAGAWEQECLQKQVIRLGFDTGNPSTFELCLNGNWAELKQQFLARGKTAGTAERFTNEARIFFEDAGDVLWLTFVGEHLWWGIVDGTIPRSHEDGDGCWRRIEGAWRCTDVNGEPLTKDRLSGSLVKLAAYRGTSCDVDVADYAIRRINGQKLPAVERAIAATVELKVAVLDLMKLLTWQDFELLVDLLFTSTGWRRLGAVGGHQKTLDLDLVLPTTGQRAFVQVKSHARQSDLDDGVSRFGELGLFDRLFFVHHSGAASYHDPAVTVLGPMQLADMIMDVGLAGWLIRKVS